MGYVISPNDVFYGYDPWRSATATAIEAQNPIINDPPTSWYTLMSLLRDEPATFHWNRYVGSGIPGYGAIAAAVLSPFIAIPALVLPLWLVYGGIILLKIVVAHYGAWLWLRQSRVGKLAAGAGALVFSCAGIYAVWWLWPGSNVTALYPVTLYLIRRSFDRKLVPIWLWWLLGLSYLLAGFPAPVVYFAWVAVAYVLFLAVRLRRLPVRQLTRMVLASILALATAAPGLYSFTRFLQRTGYLESRSGVAERVERYSIDHLMAFIEPFRLGDPIQHVWYAQRTAANNFLETTVYLGLLTLVLALLGVFRRRGEGTWFWGTLATILVLGLFVVDAVGDALAILPGVGFSELTRLRVLLPIPAAILAAHGAALLLRNRGRWRGWWGQMIIVIVAIDLGFFAAYFYPYITPAVAKLPVSEITSWLRVQEEPFRVLPTFDMYWPNASELERFEDVRSHFSSEARYRQMFQRIDPESWGHSGTILQVNGLTLDPANPILPLLNVRYITEQPSIDILRWKVMERTTQDQPMDGVVNVAAGSVLERDLGTPDPDVWAIDLPVSPAGDGTRPMQLEVRRESDGSLIARQLRTSAQLERNEKVYVRLPRTGERLTLVVRTGDFPVRLPAAGGSASRWTFGWVRSPLIYRESLEDGRVFELLSTLPRYSAVWDVRQSSFAEMLTKQDLDFSKVAWSESAPTFDVELLRDVPALARRVNFSLLEYTPRSERLRVSAPAPAFVVASEKLVPELRVEVDGERVQPVPVNGLFWGVLIEPGVHEIAVERVVGDGWWPVSGAAIVLLIVSSIVDRRRAPRPE